MASAKFQLNSSGWICLEMVGNDRILSEFLEVCFYRILTKFVWLELVENGGKWSKLVGIVSAIDRKQLEMVRIGRAPILI